MTFHLRRWLWCITVSLYALPMFFFALLLDGSPREWAAFIAQCYRDAWAGKEP